MPAMRRRLGRAWLLSGRCGLRFQWLSRQGRLVSHSKACPPRQKLRLPLRAP